MNKIFINYDGNHDKFSDAFNKYWYKNIYLQNATVEELLKNESIDVHYDDIENLYMTKEQAKEDFETAEDLTPEEYQSELEDYIFDNPSEPLQWFLITDDWLFNWLKDNNEVVLATDYGDYWGRTTYGQSIYQDYIFAKFYNFIKN
jgi:hypothetical protein